MQRRLSWHLLVLAPAVPFILSTLAHAAERVDKESPEPAITAAERAHWAFQKLRRPQVPAAQGSTWIRTPLDAFVFARLQKAGISPAPEADRLTLLRRVTHDLTGLPPTPDELEQFLSDPRPDAYERLVERLLASPHHGERWAQHWLDVVRYAESNGYEADAERPHAWRYRDYVVRAFNEDKPYDQFLTEQLAGDELAGGKEPREQAHLWIATGFNRCGPVHVVGGNADREIARQEVLTEMTGAVGAAFLGLTVACARCHDHKFDPFSQADYYRLQAFFAAAQPRAIPIADAEEKAARDRRVAELNAQIAPLRKQVADLEAPYRKRLTEAKKASLEPEYRDALAIDAKKRTPEQKKLAEHAQILLKIAWDEVVGALTAEDRARRAAWRSQIHKLEARMPPLAAEAWAIRDDKEVPPTHLLLRGDPKRKGSVLRPAFPRVLVSEEEASEAKPSASPRAARLDRLALAHWLTQPDHPLTARVLVNRLWQHHFGRALVATPNDFGIRGLAPTHPELLDWLAAEFVAQGWSIKQMHRRMVLSSTYRQASKVQASAAALRVDPDNELLWRMNRRRLDSEALRDSTLAVTGTLNPKLAGPVVKVPLEPEVYELIFTEGEPDGLWRVTPDVREHSRRSIYLFAKRNVRLPLMEAFDRPDMLNSCPVRPVSTFAPQALILLNGPFMQQQARRFAARLVRECGSDAQRQMDRAYRLALARPPRARESRLALEFLTAHADLLRQRGQKQSVAEFPANLTDTVDAVSAASLADFCLALLNCNEFLYVN